MEDHLRNRDRLAKEWQALCAYQAEPNTCDAAQREANVKKNRNPDYVPCESIQALPMGTRERDCPILFLFLAALAEGLEHVSTVMATGPHLTGHRGGECSKTVVYGTTVQNGQYIK